MTSLETVEYEAVCIGVESLPNPESSTTGCLLGIDETGQRHWWFTLGRDVLRYDDAIIFALFGAGVSESWDVLRERAQARYSEWM